MGRRAPNYRANYSTARNGEDNRRNAVLEKCCSELRNSAMFQTKFNARSTTEKRKPLQQQLRLEKMLMLIRRHRYSMLIATGVWNKIPTLALRLSPGPAMLVRDIRLVAAAFRSLSHSGRTRRNMHVQQRRWWRRRRMRAVPGVCKSLRVRAGRKIRSSS